eukprot:scaffold4335_cov220-Pinguiococcus_pyrenoidosus.AAC.4
MLPPAALPSSVGSGFARLLLLLLLRHRILIDIALPTISERSVWIADLALDETPALRSPDPSATVRRMLKAPALSLAAPDKLIEVLAKASGSVGTKHRPHAVNRARLRREIPRFPQR